jgi:hypothetical protein
VVRFLARLVAVLAASALPALAGTPRFVSITLENDFFAGYDRHYTNGLQAAWLVDRGDLPKILRSAPPVRWSADPEFVVAIGQRIYTPVDIERDIPDPADRPYAGWLYLLADVRTQHGTIVDHVTAGVGIVGPASGARWTQDLAHRVMGQERAHGWGAQLEDEPTVMLGFERTWLGVAAGHLGRRSFDVSPRAGAMLGNALTYANLGLVARYGENLPDDVPAGHISLGPSRDGYRGNATFGWYGWLGVDARAGRAQRVPGRQHLPRRPFRRSQTLGLRLPGGRGARVAAGPARVHGRAAQRRVRGAGIPRSIRPAGPFLRLLSDACAP